MTETKARALYLSDPRLAPLRRDDLPSFLVSLPAAMVLGATPACVALGIAADAPAPDHAAEIARAAASGIAPHSDLVRLRLPRTPVPRLFRCIPLDLTTGPAMLFADPAALAAEPPPAPVPANGIDPAPDPGSATAQAQPVRFTFEVDAENRLRFLSPRLAAALDGRGTWIGATFPELEQAGLILSSREIAAALAAGTSFSGVHATVPGAPALALELGGVPLFDPTRRRLATRGFGILRPAAPDAAGIADADAAAANVVQLRGGTLSPKESTAFREIARTLTAALGRGALTPDALTRAVETGLRPPAPPADDGDARAEAGAGSGGPAAAEGLRDVRLLDHLPLGLLLAQGDTLVQANQIFFDWTGWADLAAARAAGALAPGLVADTAARHDLATASGPPVPVECSVVPAPFLGPEARIVILRRLDAGASALSADEIEDVRARARRESLDLVPWPVLLLDHDCIIRFVNRAGGARFGFGPQDMAGEPFTLVAAPAGRADAIGWIDGVARAAPVSGVEKALLLQARSGETFSALAGLAHVISDTPLLCLVLAPRAATEAAPDVAAKDVAATDVAATDPVASGMDVPPRPGPRPAAGAAAAPVRAPAAAAGEAGVQTEAAPRRAAPAPEPRPTAAAAVPPPAGISATPAADAAADASDKPMAGVSADPPADPPAKPAAARPAVRPTATQAPSPPDATAPPLHTFHQAARRLAESLGGSFTTLLAYEPPDDPAARLPEAVRSAARNVRQSLDDIAALATRPAPAPAAPCDVAAVVREALAHATPAARRRRVVLRGDIDVLPQIRIAQPRLARLIRLLLEEATAASPANASVAVSVAVEDAAPGAPVVLRVSDAGEAVDEVALDAARDPLAATGTGDRFSRAGRPFRLVRLMAEAEALGGRLRLQRGQPAGMSVILELPR